MSAPPAHSWSHHCTACGKCCNSAPQMTVPELFHHQHRFIGALGVRRMARPSSAAGFELAERILHRASEHDYFALLTHAIDYSTSNRCPALANDGLCVIHDNRKPRACAVVPLDALLPDNQQHAVLGARAAGGVEYIGADCIVPGEHSAYRVHTLHGTIADPQARQALDDHRLELAADKRFWGQVVFSELQRDVLSHRDGQASIPRTGVLTLPLAPALIVLGHVSNRCRQRCIEYLEAQLALMEHRVHEALQRKHAAERAFTAQMRSFSGVTQQLLQRLQHHTTNRTADAEEVEVWLGLHASPLNPEPHKTTPTT